MTRKTRPPQRRNPVAKHAARFQKAATFRDRTRYRRHAKHKGGEPFPAAIPPSRRGKGLVAA